MCVGCCFSAENLDFWVCPVFLLIFALCAIGRFGLLPCSRSPQGRPLCRARECRFVGLLAVLARKVFYSLYRKFVVCAVYFYLRAAASWARCRDWRSLCFSLNAGSALAFSAVFVVLCVWLSLGLFSPFWGLGFLRVEFLSLFSLFCVSRDTRCRFSPLCL